MRRRGWGERGGERGGGDGMREVSSVAAAGWMRGGERGGGDGMREVSSVAAAGWTRGGERGGGHGVREVVSEAAGMGSPGQRALGKAVKTAFFRARNFETQSAFKIMNMTTNTNSFRPLGPGLLGITLLLPASYFMLTMTARIFGAKSPYYFIAPSFLQSPFHLFAFHKAQIILVSLVLAILVNLRYRRHWLNAAVAFQS